MTEEHALQRYKIESITVYLENQCTKIVRKRRWNSPTLTRTPNTKHQKYKNHSQKSWNKRTAASKKPLKL